MQKVEVNHEYVSSTPFCADTIVTISALVDPVILPDSHLIRPSQLLICFLTPSSLQIEDYETRWITQMNAVITATSGRYVVTWGPIPVNGILNHPGTILGIQYLSYTDAGIYKCEARSINSTNEADWVSASVHLQLNSKLGLVCIESNNYGTFT